MSSPRVSIGIPFVKDAPLLADAIRSIFAQTLSDWELLLVDDGASVDCMSLVRSLRDPRVRVVSEDSQNRGQAYRRNQIAQLAQGEYLAVMDADDLMHPERLRRQVQYLDQHAEAHAVASNTYIIDKHNQPVAQRSCPAMASSVAAVLKGCHVLHGTVTARTGWFRQNPYDPTFRRGEDRELWCRTCTTSVYGHIPECLYFYRQGDVNVQNYINNYRADFRLFRRHGPSSLGRTTTAYRMLLLRLKILAYRAFGAVNAQSILAHWYSAPLLSVDAAAASRIIHDIQNAPLPSTSFSPEKMERIGS